MPKDTKTLGNNKARACESLGFVHKKGCALVLTPLEMRVQIVDLKAMSLFKFYSLAS